MADPYQLNGTTLKNKLGLVDGISLAAAEADLVAVREAQLRAAPFMAPRSLQDLKEIHRHLFQDVYDWAGEFRSIDLRKNENAGSENASCFTSHLLIERRASEIDSALAETNYFGGLDKEEFNHSAADLFIAINRLHPFREGNGRAQRLFLERIASAAGHEFDFKAVTRERMVSVSIAGHNGDVGAVVRMLDEISDPIRVAALNRAFNFLRRSKFDWNDLYIATTVTGQAYEGTVVARDPSDTRGYLLRVDEPEARLLIGVSDDLDEDTEPGDETGLTASRFGPI